MSAQAGRTSLTLFQRACHEIPDIVVGTGLAITGLVLSGLGLTMYYSKDGDNRRYKGNIVVMRPDDPRATKVHKD